MGCKRIDCIDYDEYSLSKCRKTIFVVADNCSEYLTCQPEPVAEVPCSVGLCAEDKAELEHVLTSCKTKLQIYRTHSDGKYHGGMEHIMLIRMIEETYKKFCA